VFLKIKGALERGTMKIKPQLVAVLACAAVVAAFAQTPHTPPSPADIAAHQVKRMTTLLSLTSAQQQQATTIYTNAATAEQSIRQSDRATHESLRTAVKNNDAAGIDQAASTIAQTTAQLTSIRAKADAAFYQVLTADQQAKFTELESEHMGVLGGPGEHGGPGAMGFR
jgi:Spy/CpxP family protein refolding chaperone